MVVRKVVCVVCRKVSHRFEGSKGWAHPAPSRGYEAIEHPQSLNKSYSSLPEYSEVTPESVADMSHACRDNCITRDVKRQEHSKKDEALVGLDGTPVPQIQWSIRHAGRPEELALLGVEVQANGLQKFPHCP